MSAKLADEMDSDMFDTMTITKALGGFCGALLVFMLGGWAAEGIYSRGHGASHGGEYGEVVQAYIIEVEGAATEAGAEPVEEGPSFEELFAVADPVAGESAFRACAGCHAVEAGKNGTGPYLHGVVGRAVETAVGFEYDGALIAVNDIWTPEQLDLFLADPQGYAPGTKMSYSGMRKAEDRANVIAYLATLGG
jgi:cytochrome c